MKIPSIKSIGILAAVAAGAYLLLGGSGSGGGASELGTIGGSFVSDLPSDLPSDIVMFDAPKKVSIPVSDTLFKNYLSNLSSMPVGVTETPFGSNVQPLEFSGEFIGTSPLYFGGSTGHTNVEATSLPSNYWIDAGAQGVTLVSQIPAAKKVASESTVVTSTGSTVYSGGSVIASSTNTGRSSTKKETAQTFTSKGWVSTLK